MSKQRVFEWDLTCNATEALSRLDEASQRYSSYGSVNIEVKHSGFRIWTVGLPFFVMSMPSIGAILEGNISDHDDGSHLSAHVRLTGLHSLIPFGSKWFFLAICMLPALPIWLYVVLVARQMDTDYLVPVWMSGIVGVGLGIANYGGRQEANELERLAEKLFGPLRAQSQRDDETL